MTLQIGGIMQVEDLWQGSVLSQAASGGDFAPLVFAGHNNAVALLLICVAFLGIVMFRPVALSVAGSVVAIFSENRRNEIYNDSSYTELTLLSTVLLIPLFAFVILQTGASELDFWKILIILASLYVFRSLMFACMAWTSGDKGVYDIKKFSDSAFIILMTASLPLGLIGLMAPQMNPHVARIYLFIVSLICLLPYWLSAVRKIISLRFSRFFAFLYLCALEFLPIAVAVKILF